MSDDVTGAPTLLGFGLVCLAAAAVLAWYSSVTTLDLARTGDTATLTYETRLFNLVTIDRQTFPDVTGVSLLRSRLAGARSDTPAYLLLLSKRGQIDAGYIQQRFWRDVAAIDDFFTPETSPPPPALHLSSIARSDDFRLFAFGHAAAVFLALLGLGISWFTVRAIIEHRRAIGRV